MEAKRKKEEEERKKREQEEKKEKVTGGGHMYSCVHYRIQMCTLQNTDVYITEYRCVHYRIQMRTLQNTEETRLKVTTHLYMCT